MSSGKSLKLLCILPVGMLCLSTISMMLVKNDVGSVYGGLECLAVCMVGMVVCKKADSVSSVNCVQSAFL